MEAITIEGEEMAFTAEQLRIAAEIDAAMQKRARASQDDVTILAGV